MPKGVHSNHACGPASGMWKGGHTTNIGPLYRAWKNMRMRCRPHHPRRKDYYDRGICVDPAWDDFTVFAADMGPHPGPGWSLDRINNNDGYRRGNCRWANADMQANNARYRSSFPRRDKQGKFTNG